MSPPYIAAIGQWRRSRALLTRIRTCVCPMLLSCVPVSFWRFILICVSGTYFIVPSFGRPVVTFKKRLQGHLSVLFVRAHAALADDDVIHFLYNIQVQTCTNIRICTLTVVVHAVCTCAPGWRLNYKHLQVYTARACKCRLQCSVYRKTNWEIQLPSRFIASYAEKLLAKPPPICHPVTRYAIQCVYKR